MYYSSIQDPFFLLPFSANGAERWPLFYLNANEVTEIAVIRWQEQQKRTRRKLCVCVCVDVDVTEAGVHVDSFRSVH